MDPTKARLALLPAPPPAVQGRISGARSGLSTCLVCTMVVLACLTPVGTAETILQPPPAGIYHAAFPDFGGWEDQVEADSITNFVALAGKDIAWAYFSNNWFEEIRFPADDVATIHEAGITPFIRIMPRHEDESLPDSVYTMQAFIDGQFDTELIQWARDAKGTEIPLLAEFGTEVNGDWFPWCGQWNGAGETTGYGDPLAYDGPERFRDAYRHIIDIFRGEEALNITWFFHVDCYSWPEADWNRPALYYPGDNYIDWIGISCYGPQLPDEGWWWYTEAMDSQYSQLAAVTAEKPMALLEFGVIDYAWLGDKAAWIADACAAFQTDRYPRLKAMCWWQESFDETNLRIDSSPEALAAYQQCVADTLYRTELVFSPGGSDVNVPVTSGSALHLQISPGPFIAGLHCECVLPEAGFVRLSVYDAAGRHVRTLLATLRPPGLQTAHWDGQSADGRWAPPAVYFVVLEACGQRALERVVCVR